jgi:alkylation response protein AidB-like acyl-CoA dehydrogenase
MGAVLTGVAQAAYEEALAYTQRASGVASALRAPAVQKHLFEMFTKVTNCRLCRAPRWRISKPRSPVARVLDRREGVLHADRVRVADTALQLFGGRGQPRSR